MNIFEPPTIGLIKLLGKLKVKNKETVLELGCDKIWTYLFRTDVLWEALKEQDYKAIEKLYREVWS